MWKNLIKKKTKYLNKDFNKKIITYPKIQNNDSFLFLNGELLNYK